MAEGTLDLELIMNPGGVPKQLEKLREKLFACNRFKPMIEAERERLASERGKSAFNIKTSLWSRLVQTCEDEVLQTIARALFDQGWKIWTLSGRSSSTG